MPESCIERRMARVRFDVDGSALRRLHEDISRGGQEIAVDAAAPVAALHRRKDGRGSRSLVSGTRFEDDIIITTPDELDHAAHRAAAIEIGRTAAHDFDAIDGDA